MSPKNHVANTHHPVGQKQPSPDRPAPVIAASIQKTTGHIPVSDHVTFPLKANSMKEKEK
jgi:hypothetical protein